MAQKIIYWWESGEHSEDENHLPKTPTGSLVFSSLINAEQIATEVGKAREVYFDNRKIEEKRKHESGTPVKVSMSSLIEELLKHPDLLFGEEYGIPPELMKPAIVKVSVDVIEKIDAGKILFDGTDAMSEMASLLTLCLEYGTNGEASKIYQKRD